MIIILLFIQIFIFTSLQAMETGTELIDLNWEWKDNEEEVKEQPSLEELCKTLALLKTHPNYDIDNLFILNLHRQEKRFLYRDLIKTLKKEIILTKASLGTKKTEALLNDQELKNIIAVRVLNLSYNVLEQLPDAISQLTGLTELDLTHNKLTSLPTAIGYLTNLKSLNVEANQLRNLPLSIGNLTELRILQIRDNKQLESLPDTMTRLTALTDLNGINKYGTPQLIYLPAGLENLPNLTAYDIEQIRTRRKELGSNARVRQINDRK